MSSLSQQLRALRAAKNEKLLDMANRMEVSSSFLSAVETGRKEPPAEFARKVARIYDLGPKDALKLELAADAARSTFRIRPATSYQRDTVSLLARKMNALSEEDHRKLQEAIQLLIEKGKKDV